MTDTEPCLDAETLAAYLDGLLAADAIGRADRHIDRCSTCRGELSALAATHSFPAGSGGARAADLDLLAHSLEGKLGRYEILRELGRGNMGIVVRAYDPELHRAVAVKLLASSHGAEAAQRLRREAQAMARLTHPNVVSVYDVTAHGEAVAIAMELVEGTTLRAQIGKEWRAMLDVCIAAGRGLAAAHAAKLIHRDFKPENVLCADDGRVVVSDFGLARIDEDTPAPAGDGLTTTLAGTPAYMAPELFAEGGLATTASDQFSFCVTTYEALYGERPFAGRTLDDLRASIVAGALRPAPAGSSVPAGIRAVLARGFSTDPARRFPSMEALLDALATAARARRQRWPFVLGGIAAIALAVVILVGMRRGASCDLGEVAPPWDAPALATALAARPEMAARITSALEAYWRSWNATRLDACEATRVREELSERVLDARNACLERGRRELAELSALLVRDPSLADRTIEAIERVRDPASCTADSAGGVVDPAIDRAAAHLAAGEAEQAKQLVTNVLAANPDARTRAEALYVRGRAEVALGAIEAAEATLAEAVTDAERAHVDQLVAAIWVEIVQTTGAQQHRFEAARANMRAAEAAFARVDPGPAILARYSYVVGTVLLAHGDLEEARVQLERALAAQPASHIGERGMIHHALCDTYRQLRDLAKARAACETAEKELVAAYGPDHLRLAILFNVWGALELAADDVPAARERFTRSVAIFEQRHADSERGYALALTNAANAWMREGNVDRAQPIYEKARDLFAKYHPDHGQRVFPLQGLASVALERGDNRTAIRYYEEALAIIERVYGEKSDQASVALFNLALAHSRLDELDNASRALDRVIANSSQPGKENWSLLASAYDQQGTLAEQRKDPAGAIALREQALAALDHKDQPRTRAFIEFSIGRVQLERKNYADSITHGERALAYYDSDTTDPYSNARVEFDLARALWEGNRDRARAVDLAVRARDHFAKAITGQKLDEHRARVAAWLAEHGKK